MSKLSGKKVLVTGATGFVGAHLTRKLAKLGADVRILARKTSNSKLLEEFKSLGVEVLYGDVSDRESVFRAVRGRENVFHIAALFREAKFPDSVYFDVNVEGTRNVLDAAENYAVNKVVHCSTVGVHSHIPNPPATEEEDYRPGDIYQFTKCEGEKLALEYFKSEKVNGVVVRPAMIWGEGDKRLLKLYKGIASRKFPIIGDGKTLTHWVYVHDLVNGFVLAAEKDVPSGRIYIFAGKRAITIAELYQSIAKAAGVKPLGFKVPAVPMQLLGSLTEVICKPLGIEPPIYRRRVDFFTKDRSFDTSKAETELGYVAAQDFDTEVQNIFNWYKEQNWIQ